MSFSKPTDTTDSWPIGKILKHVLLPKPVGSPKAGKKEIGLRVLVGALCLGGAWLVHQRTGGPAVAPPPSTPALHSDVRPAPIPQAASSLPTCQQPEVVSLVGQIVNNSDVAKAAGASFVTLKGVAEQGSNGAAELRSCSAVLVTTKGEDNFQYSIRWQDKQAGAFYVEGQILDGTPVGQRMTYQQITNQVAADAVEQYNIAKRSGATATDICIQAGIVTATLLQAKDEANYKAWKAVQKADCVAAGLAK